MHLRLKQLSSTRSRHYTVDKGQPLQHFYTYTDVYHMFHLRTFETQKQRPNNPKMNRQPFYFGCRRVVHDKLLHARHFQVTTAAPAAAQFKFFAHSNVEITPTRPTHTHTRRRTSSPAFN